MTPLRRWQAPSSQEVGATVEEFLTRLGGPAWLQIPGRDRSRTRAVTTLLHGNEPSGIRALHRWLRSDPKPAVDMVCLVGAVDAALAPPGFGHRYLPGHRDLNRCFREPFDGRDGAIARAILQELQAAQPEALIDIHNTSGRGPAYAVTTRMGPAQTFLTSLFSDLLILTDLRLGTIMEATEDEFPTITVECGGAKDPISDVVALEGLEHFSQLESALDNGEGDGKSVRVLKHPIRVELGEDCKVAYGTASVPQADLTLPPDIDRYNFGLLNPGTILGWLGPRRLEALFARDAAGRNRTREIFRSHEGQLALTQPSYLLMMTTDPEIAKSDCVFYILPVDHQG